MANKQEAQEDNFLDGLDLGEGSTTSLDNSDLKDFILDSDSPSAATETQALKEEEESQDSFLDKDDVAETLFKDWMGKSKDESSEEEESQEEEESSDDAEEEPSEEEYEEGDELDPVTSLNNMFRSLEKKGIMRPTNEEWKAESEEDIEQRFDYEGQVRASEYLEQLFSKYGSQNRKFIEDIVLKGLDPFDYLQDAKQINDLSSIDMEDESQLKTAYLQYETQVLGSSPDRAKRNLKRIVDSGDLEDEAKDAIDSLKEFHQKQLSQKEQMKLQQEQQLAAMRQQTMQGTQNLLNEALKNKSLDGIKITPKDASEIMDYLTSSKYSLPDGSTISEFDKDLLELRRPENLKTKVKLAILMKDKLSLERIKKEAVNEESNSLFKDLSRKKVLKSRTGNKKNNLIDFI